MRVRFRRAAEEEADNEPPPAAGGNETAVEPTSAAGPSAAPESQPEIIQKLGDGTRKIAQSMGIPFPALIAILIGECRAASWAEIKDFVPS